jgi:predicted transcriptional regulator
MDMKVGERVVLNWIPAGVMKKKKPRNPRWGVRIGPGIDTITNKAYEALLEHGPMTRNELATMLNHHVKNLSRRLYDMERAGYIKKNGDKRLPHGARGWEFLWTAIRK